MKKFTHVLLGVLFSFAGLQGVAQCNYELELWDAWGDGWGGSGGSTVDVSINSGAPTSYGDAGFGASLIVPINVNTGDDITITWNSGGNGFPNECDWQLRTATGGIVSTGGSSFGLGPGNAGVGDLPDGTPVGPFSVSCPACAPPIAMNVSPSITSALASWSAGGGETLWDLEFYELGVGSQTSTPTAGYDDVASNSNVALTGLTASTSYVLYYRADCDGAAGALESSWAGPVIFTTADPALIAPVTEDFENGGAIPTGWAQGTGNGESWVFATNGGHVGNAGSFGSSPSGGFLAYVDDSTPDNTGTTLVSPFIDASGLTTPQLSFYLLKNDEGQANSDFSVDIFDGAAWNVGAYINNGNTSGGDWEEVVVALSGFSITGPIQVRFIVDEPGTGNFYDDAAIDDVTIGEAPNCPGATDLAASAVTQSGADISWTSAGSTVTSEVHVVTSGTAAPGFTDSGNQGTQTSGFTYSAGTSATPYDVYVRDICTSPDSSAWSGPVSFTTSADYCGPDDLTDLGGATGDYPNGTNSTTDPTVTGDHLITICPDNTGDLVSVTFTEFVFENNGGTCWDGLRIYQGVGQNSATFISPLDLGVGTSTSEGEGHCWDTDAAGTGDLLGITITSTDPSGCLTFVEYSDGSATRAGYVASVVCAPPPSVEDLEVTNALDVSAEVSWTTDAGSCASGGPYTVDVLLSGFSIGAPYPMTVFGTDTVLDNLTQGTDYAVTVEAVCDPSGAQQANFSTLNCLPGDRCSYTLTLNDAGDGGGVIYNGWVTGAFVQVTAGSQVTTYTIEPATYGGPQSDDYTILACPGDSLTIEYVGTPENGGEFWSISGPGGFNYQPSTPDQGVSIISCPTCAPAIDLSASNVCENGFDASWTSGAPYDSVEVTWNYFVPPFFFNSGTSGIIVGDPGTASVVASGGGTPFPASTSIGYSIIGYCGAEQSQLDGTFTTPACLCSEQCYYALEGCDNFGDSWNGNQFEIYVDGNLITTFEVDNPGEPNSCAEGYILNDTIYTCPGSTIEVVHIDGDFNGEVNFTVESSIEGVVYTYDGVTEGGTQYSASTCPDCLAPSEQAAINLSATSAQIVWSDPAGANDFDVAVELAGGTAAAGTYTNVLADTNFTAGALLAQTDYTAYIAANCALGPSDTVEVNFTTPCASEVAPYSEDFSALALPDCWTQSGDESWIFNTGGTGHVGNAGTFGSSASGGGMANVDDSGPHNLGTTLLTPMIDVSGLTTPELNFYLLKNNEGNSNVNFSVDVWDGAAWNTGFFSNNGNTAGGDWEIISLNLSTLTITGDIQVAFVVDEVNGTDFWDDAAIDDVQVRELPSCLEPNGMAAINVTEIGADLTWNAGDTELLWDLHIALGGAPAPAEADPGNTPNLTATAYTIPDTLVGATLYDVYYRSDCNPDSSAWQLYTFQTNTLSDNYCAAGPGSNADSNLDSIGITGDLGTSIEFLNSCPGITGVIDQTQAGTLELEAGVSYDLTFVFGTCGGNFLNGGEVWIDYDGSGTFDASESIGSASATPPFTSTFNFTVPLTVADGSTVAMRAMQQEGGGGVPPMDPCATYNWGSVVDFAVSFTNSNPCPGNNGVSVNIDSATEATLTWNEVGPATEWLVEGLDGPTQGALGNDTTSVTSPTISFTGLIGGDDYFAWVGSVCATDTSWTAFTWTQPIAGAVCGLPIEITGAPYSSGVINSAGYGDDYNSSPCNTNYIGGDDVVFRYSPASTVCHSITFTAVTTWLGLHIFDACPDDAGVNCLNPDDGFFNSGAGVFTIPSFLFEAGTDYYFVASTYPTPQTGTFELSLGDDCPDCITPSDLGVADITGTSAKVGFTSTVATIDGTHAYSYAYGLNGFDIATESLGSGSDIVSALAMDTILLSGLSGSTNYQLCMWENCEFLNPGDGQSDTVCVSFNTPITNDDCATAAPIDCDDIISGFTTGATSGTLGFFTGGNEAAPDVWFTFVGSNLDDAGATPGTTGNLVRLSTCNDGITPASASYDTKIDVYTSCAPASASEFVGGNDDGTDALGGACGGFSSNFTFPTVVGTTYYVRVYGFNGGSSGNFNLQMTCESPCLPVPANDECANAETLALGAYGSAPAIEGTNSCAASESFNPSCDLFGVIQGVWYDFTTHSSGDTYFSLELDPASSLGNGAATEIHYVIYSGDQCAGTGVEEVCADIDGSDPYSQVFYNLEPDSTYQILVWSGDSEAGDFLIGVTGPPPPPANDECANAINVPVGLGSVCASGLSGTLISATQSAESLDGECNYTGDYDDVWFTATVPASGKILIDFPVKPVGANMFAEVSVGADCASRVYAPGSCSAINPKSLPIRGETVANALTPGDNIYIRVWEAGNNNIGDFEICITDPLPDNDACADAVAMPITDFGIGSWTTSRSDYAYGDAAQSCGSGLETVWFSFVATDANQIINARPVGGSSYNAVITVYDACGGSELGCFDNYGAGQMERAMPSGLTEGNTYYYTVSHSGTIGSASGDAFQTGVRKFNDGSLDEDYCGITDYTLDQAVYASRDDQGDLYSNPIVPVKGYGFRFQETTDGLTPNGNLDVAIQVVQAVYIQLDDVPGLEYGKQYLVSAQHKVKVNVNGSVSEVWSNFQEECLIGLQATVPQTQLKAEFCPSADLYLEQQIQAVPVLGATQYRFRFSGGGDTFVESSNNYSVFLYNVGAVGNGLQYATVYSVEVDVFVNGEWSGYGPACTVPMQTQPEATALQSTYCNGTYEYPQNPNYLLAEPVLGAEYYEWRFTPVGGGTAQTQTTVGISLAMHLATVDLSAGGDWDVEARAFAGGVLGDYGSVCSVTINATGAMARPTDDTAEVKVVDATAIGASIYPNPTTGEQIFITLTDLVDENQQITVEVVDITGKTAHSTQLVNKGAQANFVVDFDNPLSKGMYFVNLYINDTKLVEKLTVK